MAGLAPDPEQPGYKHFYVRPLIGGPLSSARAELDTPYGLAASEWVLNGNKLQLNAVVPPNTSATIVFPNGRTPERVTAGRHSFTLEYAKP